LHGGRIRDLDHFVSAARQYHSLILLVLSDELDAMDDAFVDLVTCAFEKALLELEDLA